MKSNGRLKRFRDQHSRCRLRCHLLPARGSAMFNLQQFIVDSHCKIIADYRELLATSTSDGECDHIKSLIETHEQSLQRETRQAADTAPRRLDGRLILFEPCSTSQSKRAPAAIRQRHAHRAAAQAAEEILKMSHLRMISWLGVVRCSRTTGRPFRPLASRWQRGSSSR